MGNSQVTEAKPLLKEALQAYVGLPVDRNIPVIGFIGRLEEQKGSDILAEAIPQFIDQDVQIIVLVRTESSRHSCLWDVFSPTDTVAGAVLIFYWFFVSLSFSGHGQEIYGETA